MDEATESKIRVIEARGKRRDPVTENPCDEWWLCCVVRVLDGDYVDLLHAARRVLRIAARTGEIHAVASDEMLTALKELQAVTPPGEGTDD